MSDDHKRQVEKWLSEVEIEQEKRNICQDLWKKLKEVSIEVLKGDKGVYED